MENLITYELLEIVKLYQVNANFIDACIEKEWIIPIDPFNKIFDRTDLARILLIKDLKYDFGANDEAIPIILHLIDQLHWSKKQANQYLQYFNN